MSLLRGFFGFIWGAPLLLLLSAAPASAVWRVAQSENFVIYAELEEERLVRLVEVLERYHDTLGAITGGEAPAPSPSNRLTIFAYGDRDEVRKLYGGSNRFVSAFYLARVGDSVAFVPSLEGSKTQEFEAVTALLHEYAHHYMASTSRYAMPLWLSEGSAEYFAASRFGRDGTVDVGFPPGHRFWELYFKDSIPARELLDPDRFGTEIGKRYEAYYGKAWLLYHLLATDPDRAGQLEAYAASIRAGDSSIKAAEKSFGDLAALELALAQHARAVWKAEPKSLGAETLSVGAFEIERLSDGAAAMVPLAVQTKRGVSGEEAQRLVAEVRRIAASYPNDAFVLAALAEAELDAGNFRAAVEAADLAIAADPAMPGPYVQKGKALFRLASDAPDKDGAVAEAMLPFEALNALENDHPAPLVYYYLSFAQRGLAAPEDARRALERAAERAPFDKNLWLSVGIMQAREGKIELAKQSLLPIAQDPHGGASRDTARRMLAMLGAAVEGEPFRP